ncbi:hypothetical protein B296_00057119 [Ensete ventricosum]|uniref:Uncharacterized protein n=1 Tax=Ensete ventricosum TaxID=4639 RepID=A0A426X6I7_ENSVE|nr:hypothetical protein B296_00057119 [Ensete ventricosum]
MMITFAMVKFYSKETFRKTSSTCKVKDFVVLKRQTPEVIPSGKGKEPVVIEEAPERGYTLRELCEVEDRVGAERYFWTEGPLSGEYLHGALHPTLAKQAYECSFVELMNRASKSAELRGRVDQDLVTVVESRAKELERDVNKLQGELESLKTKQRRLEEEVGILRSSLDWARNDRARLEGDVLSLIEATTLLEAELKSKGAKAMDAYKAS